MAVMKEFKDWKELPSNLKTKTRLKTLGLQPSGDPVAVMISEKGQRFNLFDETKAKKIKYKELDMSSFNFSALNKSDMDDYAIVSFTTTGTRTTDEIIQVTILDTEGNFVFNKKFCPTTDIHPLAYSAHKIASYDLTNEPKWNDCWYELSKVLEGKTLVMTDYPFFVRMINQSCKMYGCKLDFKLNIFDLKSNTLLIVDFAKEYDSKKSVQSANPVLDTIQILQKLNPRADLFLKKPIAMNYYNEMCKIKCANGEHGFEKGSEWLIKNFNTSNFEELDLKSCKLIAKALEPIVNH